MTPRCRLIYAFLVVGVPNKVVPGRAGLSHTGKLCKLCVVQQIPELLLLTCHTVNTVEQSH